MKSKVKHLENKTILAKNINLRHFRDHVQGDEKNIMAQLEEDIIRNDFCFRNGKSVRDKSVSIPGIQYRENLDFSLDGSKIK